jgi:hypothetical protein
MGAFDGRRPFDPIMRIAGHGAVFDCLTEIGADGAIRGELATGWEASADARVWTIRLREDAVFHDGRSFGADDVVATLRMHMAGSAAAVAGLIAQVKRTGPHEVQVVLREGRPGLPFLLADPQLVMLPAQSPERAMAEGIGTGLYRMEPGRTADRAVLRRVEQHWKDGVAGWFDRMEVLRIAAPQARLEALKTGRVDAVNMADPAWAAEARRHGRIALTATGTGVRELCVEGPGAGAVAARLRGDPADAPGAVALRISPARVPAADRLTREAAMAAERVGLWVAEDAPVALLARMRPSRPTPDWPESPAARTVFDAVSVDTLIAHSTRLQHSRQLGGLWDMDSGRIAERWWYA